MNNWYKQTCNLRKVPENAHRNNKHEDKKTGFGVQYSRAIPNGQEINFQAHSLHCENPHPTALFNLR